MELQGVEGAPAQLGRLGRGREQFPLPSAVRVRRKRRVAGAMLDCRGRGPGQSAKVYGHV